MSHSNGEVIHENEVVGFFEYDGCSDIAISAIWNTLEEVETNWRSGVWKRCTCGQPSVDVLLFTDYGGGFYWPAKVCLKCRAILGPHPYNDGCRTKKGHPLKTCTKPTS
ncbi:MAG: hypothetical protein AAB345_05025 [Patescibacteria group bacterium]